MKDIRKLSLKELIDELALLGLPSFRAKQVFEWLWKKSATDFNVMTNLSAALRQQLAEHYIIPHLDLKYKQVSNDGTIKCGFELWDKKVVEGVLIPADERMTACISSQVGCSLTCKFCATGKLERLRNLEAHEIYDQVVFLRNIANNHYQLPLSNIVYMGMGEPLLNYNNVLQSIEHITSEQGLGMAAKRITVSTAGISKMIKKLADDGTRVNLALSLHAANDSKRSEIMPINDSNTLNNLAEALNYFYAKTGTKPTLEYIALRKFNDQLADAQDLVTFCMKVPSKVNIIEYNPIGDGLFERSEEKDLNAFCAYLESKKIVVNVRRSRGKDIDAACGQLANKVGSA